MGTVALERPRAARACLFWLADEAFAVDVACAREVVVVEDRTIVPRAPRWLVGVTNLRGVILPILDVRPLLGLPAAPVARGSQVLVVEAAGHQVGVAIDGVLGLEPVDEVVPFGETARRAYGELGVGLLRRGEGLATLLDAARVLEALRNGVGKGE